MELSEEEKKLFGGTKSTGDRPPYFVHGKYLLMVDTWKLYRGGRPGQPTIISDIHNFIILKSEPNPVREDDKERTDKPNAPGSRAGVTNKWSPDDAGTMARQNSMKFILAMWGVTDADLTDQDKIEAIMRATNDDPKKFTDDYVVGEDGQKTKTLIPAVNPCRGMLIAADTAPIFTKTTKKWIVGVNFIHIAAPGSGDNSYEAAAKRWAEYESKLKAA